MKKFKLLKDFQMIDGVKIIIIPPDSFVVHDDFMNTDGYMAGLLLKPIPKLVVEKNPEYFEEIKEFIIDHNKSYRFKRDYVDASMGDKIIAFLATETTEPTKRIVFKGGSVSMPVEMFATYIEEVKEGKTFPDIKNLKKPEDDFWNNYLRVHTEGQITSHQLAKILLEAPDSFIVTTAMGHNYNSFSDRCSHGRLKILLSSGSRGEMPYVIIGDTLRDNSIPNFPIYKQLFPKNIEEKFLQEEITDRVVKNIIAQEKDFINSSPLKEKKITLANELQLVKIGTATDGDIYASSDGKDTYQVKCLVKLHKEEMPTIDELLMKLKPPSWGFYKKKKWKFRLGIRTDSTLFNADYKADPHYTNDPQKINAIVNVEEVGEGNKERIVYGNNLLSDKEQETIENIRKLKKETGEELLNCILNYCNGDNNIEFLTSKEKEIIDAFRKAKDVCTGNIKKILITPHGIIATDNAFELDPNEKIVDKVFESIAYSLTQRCFLGATGDIIKQITPEIYQNRADKRIFNKAEMTYYFSFLNPLSD